MTVQLKNKDVKRDRKYIRYVNPKRKLKMKSFIVNLRKKKSDYTKATEDSDTALK